MDHSARGKKNVIYTCFVSTYTRIWFLRLWNWEHALGCMKGTRMADSFQKPLYIFSMYSNKINILIKKCTRDW